LDKPEDGGQVFGRNLESLGAESHLRKL